jgi:hypothetical protein
MHAHSLSNGTGNYFEGAENSGKETGMPAMPFGPFHHRGDKKLSAYISRLVSYSASANATARPDPCRFFYRDGALSMSGRNS